MFRPQHNPQDNPKRNPHRNPIATILLLAAAVLSAAHVSGQSPTQPPPTPVQTAAPEAAPLNRALPTVAKDQDVAFVDMATVEADRLDALGPEKTAAYFPIDHTSAEGAELNAQFVVTALRNAKSPLTAYLKPQLSELLPPSSPGESRCK